MKKDINGAGHPCSHLLTSAQEREELGREEEERGLERKEGQKESQDGSREGERKLGRAGGEIRRGEGAWMQELKGSWGRERKRGRDGRGRG